MKQLTKFLCILLALLTALATVQYSVVPANALEFPIPEATETAEPVQTVPVQTEAIETEAVTDKPAETVPEETEPAVQSEQEQPLPEETAAPEETVSVEPIAQELAESDAHDTVPLYFQTDYPNTIYGSGSVANNGCGITALAMVATYLTEHEYKPDVLARYFGGYGESNVQRLEYGAEMMQLPWERMENFHKAMAALREGKVVIVLMGADSIFTDSQHFIVLTGMNEDGTITVNDPYEPNYEKWDLKRAFQEGFTEGDICCGYSGAWAFDKSAMPEEPFLYYEENLSGEPRYPDIELTYEEMMLLARMIWAEARGESAEGQQAVAEVVLNRLAADNFPDSLKSIIYADGQFRSTAFLDEAEPGQAQFEAIERAIYGPYILPEDVVFFATFRTNDNVWGQIGGHIFCHQW